MKVAISSSGNTLDSPLDPRFGRCAYFLVVDLADMSHEAFDNQSAARGSGAGIQTAQFLRDKNVSAVFTGHVGPNAVQTLSAVGIDIFTVQKGTVREVVKRFKSGHLKATIQSAVSSHFGMGGGARCRGRHATGNAMGDGRGLGRCGGGC